MPSFVDHPKRLLSLLLNQPQMGRPTELFRWMVADVLADLTGQPANIPDEHRDLVCQLSGEYARVVQQLAPFSDVLGPMYMEVGANDKGRFAQFFTPAHVCDLMARISIGNTPPTRILRIMEPCAGAGGMLLAACRAELERGKDGLKHYSLTAVDLDPLCAQMTAVQLLANMLIHEVDLAELFVYSGNALLLSPKEWHLIVRYRNTSLPCEDAWPEPERRQAAAQAAQQHPANRVSVLSF